jgi:tRNA threonylcarbamoyl adenosine modification protein YeaZ
MILLAIDCSAELCAACVYDSAREQELGRSVRDLGKGHAEHLIGVIDAALSSAGKAYADLEAIAVSVGPGSFTGIRVAVAAARGFSVALGIPAIGVSVLEALAAEARATKGAGSVLAARGFGPDDAAATVQAALYDEFGGEAYPPSVLGLGEAVELATNAGAALAGTGAARIAAASGGVLPVLLDASAADIQFYAQVAARKDATGQKPSPLYLREPDAKPQAGFILPRREG